MSNQDSGEVWSIPGDTADEDVFGDKPTRGDYRGRFGPEEYRPHSGDTPQPKFLTVSHEVPAVAADAEASGLVYAVPYAMKVIRAGYVSTTDITGAATNNRSVVLASKPLAGSESTEVAALTFNDGVDATAGAANDLLLSENHMQVAGGDLLTWSSTPVGTGIADPGGTMFIITERV